MNFLRRAISCSVIALAATCASSCFQIRNEQREALLTQSAQLKAMPIRRSEVISTYHLENAPSVVSNGGMRFNHMLFVETWEVPGGFKITALNSKYVGPIGLDPKLIDRLWGVHQKRFEEVYIRDKSDRTVFDSSKPLAMGEIPPSKLSN